MCSKLVSLGVIRNAAPWVTKAGRCGCWWKGTGLAEPGAQGWGGRVGPGPLGAGSWLLQHPARLLGAGGHLQQGKAGRRHCWSGREKGAPLARVLIWLRVPNGLEEREGLTPGRKGPPPAVFNPVSRSDLPGVSKALRCGKTKLLLL